MSKKTQKKNGGFVYLVRNLEDEGEHKGCWITWTSHSFSPSLLFFLYCGWWTLKKRCFFFFVILIFFIKLKLKFRVPQILGCYSYNYFLNPRDSVLWSKQFGSLHHLHHHFMHIYEDPPLMSITHKANS